MARQLRKAVLDEIIPDRSAMPMKFEWRVEIPGEPVRLAQANTKSEVRAAIKRVLGHVPAGTKIEKTGVSPRHEFIKQRVHDAYLASGNGAAESSPTEQPPADAGSAAPVCAAASAEPGLSDAGMSAG